LGDQILPNILTDESGQSMVEYGLILGFIALAVVLTVAALGPRVSKMFENAANKLPAS